MKSIEPVSGPAINSKRKRAWPRKADVKCCPLCNITYKRKYLVQHMMNRHKTERPLSSSTTTSRRVSATGERDPHGRTGRCMPMSFPHHARSCQCSSSPHHVAHPRPPAVQLLGGHRGAQFNEHELAERARTSRSHHSDSANACKRTVSTERSARARCAHVSHKAPYSTGWPSVPVVCSRKRADML